MNYSNLENFCYFVKDKINVDKLNNNNYISTENMLPNKGGKTKATKIPNTKTAQAYNKNDILVSNIRPYFKKIWKANTIGGCSNDVLVFRANTEVSPEFLFYVLSNDTFFNYSMSTSKGTKMPRGDKKALMQYKVPNLEYNMQKKIASILSAIDDKIELNNKINTKLLQIGSLIFHKYYELGELKTLEAIVDIIESGSREKGGAIVSGVPSVGAEKIERFGIYDYSKEKYISKKYFNNLKKGIIKSGDVLLYKDGAYTGKSTMALNNYPYETCAVNEHVFILRTIKNFAQFYLYFCISKEEIKNQIFSLASSKAAQPGLNQKELFSVKAKIPSKKLIYEFEKIVEPLMNMISENSLESNKLKQLRDTLLPKLMSGELDVSNLDI